MIKESKLKGVIIINRSCHINTEISQGISKSIIALEYKVLHKIKFLILKIRTLILTNGLQEFSLKII
jgi:predicted nucleotide-binding protein (sugar kinase/HSP70/actin superfamily)